MITPITSELPSNKYSKQRIEFVCDCGNKFKTNWANFATGASKSCGSCKLFLWKKTNQTKFNSLKLITNIEDVIKLTEKYLWKCDCGKEKLIKPHHVLSGKIKSCGCLRHNIIIIKPHYESKKKEDWLLKLPNLVDKNLPNSWTAGTNKKFDFLCNCGKTYTRKFNRYSPNSTCNKCEEVNIKNGDKINSFVYVGDKTIINKVSNSKELFICKCGRKELLKIREVFSGYKKTCNKCNEISATQSLEIKFGKLRIKHQQSIKKHSDKKIEWLCDCGNEALISITSVCSGYTKSCGKCSNNIKNWYIENQIAIKSLKCPVQPGKIFGGIEALETITSVSKPFKAICEVCKNIYYPRLHGIKTGESLTCGCTSNNSLSVGQGELMKFIKSLNIDVESEYKTFGYKYDIFVPKNNLLIEFHGLKWHGSEESKKRDKIKYDLAIKHDYSYLVVYEDEWKYRKESIKNLVKNRLNKFKPISIRPKQCDLRKTSLQEADFLYEQFHYIGKAKSKLNYGAWYKNQLIACMSFKNPTRQSKHDYELVRMVSHPNFRVHGIWTKLLNMFVLEHNLKSIVSFSDNRLFSGKIYEKLGFKFDGLISSDYFWTKNKKRYHKSSLRKKGEEKLSGKTETQLREAQGYYKIWDLGKKRWVINVENKN